MTRVAVVGSRDYPDLDAVRAFVHSLPQGTVVVSGGARGVDRTAADEARLCGLAVDIHMPDWGRDGRRAGLLRNASIVAACDRLVAFWAGASTGTAHTLSLARRAGRPCEVRTIKAP